MSDFDQQPESSAHSDHRTGGVHRAGAMQFVALGYHESAASESGPVAEPRPATYYVAEHQPLPQISVDGGQDSITSAEQIVIPTILSRMLGGMALLLFLVSTGLLIAHFWETIPMLVRVCSLLFVPSVLWLFYIIAYHKGYRSGELASLLAAISWADAVIIYQLCIQQLPLWVAAVLLTTGLLLIPIIRPWKAAITAVFAAGILQYYVMGHSMLYAQTYGEWALIAVSALATLIVWSHLGVWCSLTSRDQYRKYSFLSFTAQILYLMVLILLLVYPQTMLPAQLTSTDAPVSIWMAVIAIWIVVLLPCLPMQKYYAEKCNHPNISNSFLLYWGTSILVVPLGVMLAPHVHPLVILPLVLVNLLSMAYYGADYQLTRFVVMGSLGIFLSLISIPIHLQTGLLPSACILLAFAVLFYLLMMHQNARRRAIIRRRREEVVMEREAARERSSMPEYHEMERFAIKLPSKD